MTKAIIERLTTNWRALQPRERRLVGGGALVLAVVLAVQLLWVAHDSRMRLLIQVPQLQAQLEAMRQQGRDMQKLQALPVPPALANDAAVEATVRSGAGSLGAGLAVRATAPRQVAVQGEVAFDRFVEWVGQLQASHRLRLLRCEIAPAAMAGLVRVDAEFVAAE